MAEVSTYTKALRIRVEGIVQGVGFRPYVYRLATELNIAGWVINRSDGVLIHAEGENEDVDHFFSLVKDRAPMAAIISGIGGKIAETGNYERFTIKRSQAVTGSFTGISPDIAVCPDCLGDLKTQPHRSDYPLINCTNCGPRFSIISGLPYDRLKTSMEPFSMCASCKQEYTDPDNRRFHAQPVACNNCGPSYLMETPGIDVRFEGIDFETLCKILENGGVALIKGTGGYHLVCNAADYNAVKRVRKLKGRDRKPFAVMVRDAGKVKEYCITDSTELDLLQSWRRPVVLFRQRPDPGNHCHSFTLPAKISSNVNWGLNTLGVILPYMPFHYLLFEKLKLDALVFTSANISGDPVIYDDAVARSVLGSGTDSLISYNREIANPVDDSVCRVTGGNIQILRRARGYVPGMIDVPFEAEGIFAAGSDIKNTFVIGKGNYALMSQHTGDLENYETLCRYKQGIGRFSSLFNFKPSLVACDLHPAYFSVKYAERYAEETGSRLIRVQHHHAHIASCMAEHGIVEPVIGVCFDGTGFGDDGNIWGSEFMICDYSHYERHSHLSYIQLPGGEMAIREPWRIALACLRAIGHKHTAEWIGSVLNDIPAESIETVDKMITGNINSPLSCGAGRWFDAVASLAGLCNIAGFDGEGPMMLESICCPRKEGGYDFQSDTLKVIDQVMTDIMRGTTPDVISSRFHTGMAKAVRDNVISIHKTTAIDKVVLSGGVFQNSYLLNRVIQLLEKEKVRVYTNTLIPVNDGGLALGQLAVAAVKTE